MHTQFEKHLEERGFREDAFLWIDYEAEVVVFPIYTIDGRLIGFENYNWRVTDKTIRNKPSGRYFKFITEPEHAVYGLYYITDFTKPLYVVEGAWDAERVRCTGRNCIAVLQNNPVRLKDFFASLNCVTVSICDGDDAGKMLAKSTDLSMFLDDDSDPNDISVSELDEMLTCFELENGIAA